MIGVPAHGRNDVRRRSKQAIRPDLEGLEERRLLAFLNGGQWYYPVRITYSFMPDGTNVGGVPSTLFQTLGARFSQAAWQGAFQKAAAIWQQVAGINLAQVSDNGAPVGGGPYQQGDGQNGDIRIGGTPMSMSYLAYALLPPPINGGSDAGDIVINTQQAWQINNDFDLQTVAIHEFGHALGLDHSAAVAADMYATYVWMKQSLNADDASGIQRIYGGVPNDPTNNSTMSTAIDLSGLVDGQQQVAMGAGYVTNANAFEWYRVTVPNSVPGLSTGSMVVKMQTNDLSSLAPRLAVYNSAGASLGQAVAANVYGTTVTLTISNVSPGQVYYVRASAANTGPGSNGAFGLLINFGNRAQAPITPPSTVVLAQPDQGVNGWTGEAAPKARGAGRGRQHAPTPGRHAHRDNDAVVIKLGGGQRALGHALKVGPLRHPRPAKLRRR